MKTGRPTKYDDVYDVLDTLELHQLAEVDINVNSLTNYLVGNIQGRDLEGRKYHTFKFEGQRYVLRMK